MIINCSGGDVPTLNRSRKEKKILPPVRFSFATQAGGGGWRLVGRKRRGAGGGGAGGCQSGCAGIQSSTTVKKELLKRTHKAVTLTDGCSSSRP